MGRTGLFCSGFCQFSIGRVGAGRQTNFFVLSCGELYGEPMSGALGGTSGSFLMLGAGQGLERKEADSLVLPPFSPPENAELSYSFMWDGVWGLDGEN